VVVLVRVFCWKWLSRRLPGRCRSKINKRIDTIENRLQKEADKKDGRDLDDIEADKEKAERAVAKAEKLTKYVQGTLEAVDGGAVPRPPAPVLPKSLFCLRVPAVVATDPCSRPRLSQTACRPTVHAVCSQTAWNKLHETYSTCSL